MSWSNCLKVKFKRIAMCILWPRAKGVRNRIIREGCYYTKMLFKLVSEICFPCFWLLPRLKTYHTSRRGRVHHQRTDQQSSSWEMLMVKTRMVMLFNQPLISLYTSPIALVLHYSFSYLMLFFSQVPTKDPGTLFCGLSLVSQSWLQWAVRTSISCWVQRRLACRSTMRRTAFTVQGYVCLAAIQTLPHKAAQVSCRVCYVPVVYPNEYRK